MNLASYIDHTLLRPDCTLGDIRRICQEALDHSFAAVCIPPYFVPEAAQILEGNEKGVKIATVAGFPMGFGSTASKVEAIKRTIEDGADEIDAVINLNAVKNGDWAFVQNEMDSMITTARLRNRKIKIIIETGLLNEDQIRKLCAIALEVKPDFLKTSTGFNGTGAEPHKVRLMAELLQKKIAIKASGGIRTAAEARAFIEAGASRIGSSSGVAIVQEG